MSMRQLAYETKMIKLNLHSIESHNYWIKRNGVCPYCNMGSKPVPKDVIINKVKI